MGVPFEQPFETMVIFAVMIETSATNPYSAKVWVIVTSLVSVYFVYAAFLKTRPTFLRE